jgi:epimerase transport system membrane fusion protein
MSATTKNTSAELIPADKTNNKAFPNTLDSFAKTSSDTTLPVINTNDGQYAKYGWMALIIVFLFGGIWAATAPLNSAAVAIGEVVVVSHNKVVQHFEGGLVESILVDEGDEVVVGQTLIRLSPTQASSELSMVTSQLNEALGLEARLRAEQQNVRQITFPEALTSQLPNPTIQEIIDSQAHVFKARRESLNAEQAVFNQRIKALEQQMSGLGEYITTLDSRIRSFEAELKDWNELFLEQFADKMRVQEISRELDRLRGERSQNVSEIARLQVQVAETENQKILAKQQFLQEVVSELPRVQAQRIDLSFRKVVLEDRLARIEITAPDNGIVKGLNVFTLGSVIRPGDTLMEIVPKREEFGLRVRVNPTNINTVNVGLLVDVRFSAFNTQTTHVVEGQVTHISADKFTDERQGVEYFEARIRITENGINQMREDGLFILPGMPVEAMIKTGERTVFGYFVKPFQDMFARAFRED